APTPPAPRSTPLRAVRPRRRSPRRRPTAPRPRWPPACPGTVAEVSSSSELAWPAGRTGRSVFAVVDLVAGAEEAVVEVVAAVDEAETSEEPGGGGGDGQSRRAPPEDGDSHMCVPPVQCNAVQETVAGPAGHDGPARHLPQVAAGLVSDSPVPSQHIPAHRA